MKSENIYIRQVIENDKQIFYHLMREQDSEIDQKTLEQEWHRVWQSKNLLLVVVIEKTTDNIVGFIEAKRALSDSPVIGIILLKKYRGIGYGQESMKLFISYFLLEINNCKYFIYGVMESNIASIKLVKKIDNSVFIEKAWIAAEQEYLLIYWIFNTYEGKSG